MNNEFQVILDLIDTQDDNLKELAERVINLCLPKNGSIGIEEAIKVLDEKAAIYEADFRSCDNVPFCKLLLSYAYWCWGDLPRAANHAEKAIVQFNRCGDQWNLGLSHWGRAFVYQDQVTHLEEAVNEYQHAYKIFNGIDQDIEHRGLNNKVESSKEITEHINDKIKELKNRVTPAYNQTKTEEKKQEKAPEQKSSPSHLWPTAHIVYGVKDIGQANSRPIFEMADARNTVMTIESISLDGAPYSVYNPRIGTGNQIKLVSSGNYRWLKVAGKSMNLAAPVPIEPGDFVLVNLGLQGDLGNIVVADLKDPPAPGEKATVIKRYTGDGLDSESSEPNELIPLNKARIRGVLIAVAKPLSL